MSVPLSTTKWPVAVGLGVAGSLIVALVVLAFLWPAKTTTPQHLPVSVSGPASAVTALRDAVAAQSPDAFEFVEASDRADAVAQIEARESYGAFILGEGATPPEVLTAPAASAAATQILNGVAAQLQAQLSQQVVAAGGDAAAATITVTPVVSLSDTDPSGSGLAAASFPLMMGGMVGGILISLLVVGASRRLIALAAFGVSVGVVLAFMLQTWFGFLQGDFMINTVAIGLSILATSSFIVGCTALLGSRGVPLGALVTMFVGSPLASAATPWQFLPEPWGAIGQFFVPGASNWLMRSLSYFPEANVTPQWLILTGWTALGLVLILIGHLRARAAAVPVNLGLEPERELVTA